MQDWGPPDVVLVSDMVNVAALVGLARRSLGEAAVVLYLHENQLTYPLPEGTVRDEGYAMANWVSMCAADVVAFNSEHHRSELLAALPGFLRRFPDHRHSALVDDVAERAVVLPVGIDPSLFALDRKNDGGAPIVLWNHRWEYDKDPRAFFAAMEAVERAGVDFRLAIAGQSYQTVPLEFDEARRRFADRLVHFGTAPEDEYRRLLARADVVVSTARHDFFGLAVAEAIGAGALPILPQRLSYPELVAPDLADRCLYPDGESPTDALVRALSDRPGRERDAGIARRHVGRFAWPVLIGAYDDLIDATVSGRLPVR